MKNSFIIFIFLLLVSNIFGQRVKLKNTINYNAFGMDAVPYEQIMVGGNHVFYKSLGFALSYRFGIKDFLEPIGGKAGSLDDLNIAKKNNFLTGKTSTAYAFSVVPSIAISITNKIPIYFGAGITRRKIYKEYLEPGSLDKFWFGDNTETKILPTFTAGIFIPIYRRLLLNLAYDHLPQSVFVGISIRGWDSWDEFN